MTDPMIGATTAPTPAPQPPQPAASLPRACVRALLPACFLAASWTWVIGMFLPVLLTDRFGVAGWAVFALSNVFGAASVGIVLAKPHAALRFAREHATAIGLFSLVTLAFHAYAVGWILRRTLGGPAGTVLPFGLDTGPAVTVAMSAFVALWFAVALLPRSAARWVAAGTLLVSIASSATAALGLYVGPFPTDVPSLPAPPEDPMASALSLALAAPAIAAGFLACPYLDATLNDERQRLGEPTGSLAFALGFGGPFLLMITITLGYAHFWHEHRSLPAVLALHMIAQSAFTAGVHTRALRATRVVHTVRGIQHRRTVLSLPRLFAATFAVLLMLPLGNAVQDFGQLRAGLTFGKLGYEAFIALYALVFPAYLWVCAVPITPLRDAPRGRRIAAFAVCSLVAMPSFAVGSLEQIYALVPTAYAIIAATPWIAAKRSGPAITASSGPDA